MSRKDIYRNTLVALISKVYQSIVKYCIWGCYPLTATLVNKILSVLNDELIASTKINCNLLMFQVRNFPVKFVASFSFSLSTSLSFKSFIRIIYPFYVIKNSFRFKNSRDKQNLKGLNLNERSCVFLRNSRIFWWLLSLIPFP